MLKKIYFANGSSIHFKGRGPALDSSKVTFSLSDYGFTVLKKEYKEIKKRLRS